MPLAGDAEAGTRVELGPLPGGHHGLSREEVAESQHERLIAATAELIAERGYGDVPITEIAKRASVANRVFYENFRSKEEAFLAAFDAIADHVSAVIAASAEPAADWPDGVVAALGAAIDFFDAEPKLARFCLVAPFTSTPKIAAHARDRAAAALPHLARGRDLHPGGAQLPTSTEDSLLGGVVSQLTRSLLAGVRPLAALLPDLIEFVLTPYLGPDEARRHAVEARSAA
ncbi:MAG TPA: TetR/AcrR family transcriptional regulator [Solirubrobacterales bacterium]|nr:TetR/AcrR family transcriptional regulator [Solirubrobacterales bacterium]